jgi:hypothetical protein
MEFSHDHVRRGLADARREQAEALPRWRAALTRVFDPDAGHSERAKREILGLPDRRAFLRVGGLTVAMSAVIAACSSSKTEELPVTGSPPTTPEEGKSVLEPSQVLDVTLLRTAQSIEVLAVQTYQTALDSGLVTSTALADTIRLFQEQHGEHAGLISATTRDAGGTPYDQPNAYLDESVVAPAVAQLASQADVVTLAVDLENTAAQTYVFASELLTTPALRQGIMSIGGVEGRHLAVLYTVQEQPPAPFPLMPRRDRVDAKGFVPPDEGDVLTPTTQAGDITTSGTAAQ